MNLNLIKENKQNNPIKKFLMIFVFVFLLAGLFGASTNIVYAASDSCTWLSTPLICTAQSMLTVTSAFVALAVSLFGWAADPSKMNAIINNESIYMCWKNVRDFLNIAFILFLLFSAFCTVFQVSKYSYKSILLNLVLMALLVNFSFPITRFIIDVANVLTYTLVSELFAGNLGSLTGTFAQVTKLGEIAAPAKAGLVQLIALNIFLFIFGVTFLTMAFLFIIRIIALSILIIFSPIAFTGSIIPGLQDKASGWWTQLFNYAFFAPIMVFMLYVACSLTNATTTSMASLQSIAATNSEDPSWLVNLCKFSIPIVILWIGMGVAKSMSVAGAGTVTDFAQNRLKGIGKSISGFNFAKKQYDAYAGARKKREEEIAKNRYGGKIGTALNKGQDTLISKITGSKGAAAKRLKKTKSTDFDDDAKKAADKHDATATTAITRHLTSGAAVAAASNPANRDAAIDFAGQYKQLISDPVRKAEHEGNIRLAQQANASAAATAAGVAPQDRSAYMEAFIQQQIATSWGTMRANYNAVKKVHTNI